MKRDRKARRRVNVEDIERQHKESQAQRMSGRNKVLKADLPLPLVNLETGDYLFDILPFVRGKNDPMVVRGKMKVGTDAYYVEVWTHGNVGPENYTFICNKKTFGKPCFYCEEVQRRMDKGEDFDDYKHLNPKKFPLNLYNVWIRSPREERKKGNQILSVSAFYLQQELEKLAKGFSFDEDDEVDLESAIPFYQPNIEEGRSIAFKFEAGKKGKTFANFSNIQFVKRKKDIPDKIIDGVINLADCLYVPEYMEFKEAALADDASEDKSDGSKAVSDLRNKLEKMDRSDLKRFIKKKRLTVKVFKSDDEDDIIEKIIEEMDEDVPY